jgi:biopolymer transport protein ExbD
MGSKNPDNNDEILAEINMTPLIDIMLVLLIIFMVTSSVSLESGLDIDLPKTASKTENKGAEAVIVSLDSSGNLSVQGQKVDPGALKEAIHKELMNNKTSLVILEGDRQSTLERAIGIMDIAKEAGAQKFAIATEGH